MRARDRLRRYGPVLTFLLATTLLFVTLTGTAASENLPFREEGVTFLSAGSSLGGTVLIPTGPGPKPGMVLVHGAGNHDRDSLRLEAEEFARRGIVSLVYDKRRDGYSQFERSYAQLAGDVAAATQVLAAHPEVDTVGLWGVSEGAWVAPLAAADPAVAADIDFVVLVAPTGVSPARQHAWFLEGRLRAAGVGGSLIHALAYRQMRLVTSLDLFAEALHDPVAPLRGVEQPVLALWGGNDDIEPAAESMHVVGSTLRQAGNPHVELAVLPDAGHDLRRDGELVPGYADQVAAFVEAVAAGEPPDPRPDPPAPAQAHSPRPYPQLGWWEAGWLHLGLKLGLIVAFAVAAVTLPGRLPTASWWVRPAFVAGAVTVAGATGYLGYLLMSDAAGMGPVIANRALVWLALQVGAVAALAGAAAFSTMAVRRRRGSAAVTALVAIAFGAWAGYWGLLSV